MTVQGKDLNQLPYKAPGHPYMNIFIMVACIIIILISGWSYFVAFDAVNFVGTYAGALIVLFGYLILKFWTKSKIVPLDEIDLDTGVRYFTVEELDAEKDEDKNQSFWNKMITVFI